MKRNFVKLCVFVTFIFSTALQAQTAVDDVFLPGGQLRQYSLTQPHWPVSRAASEAIGCAPLTESSVFARAEYDCKCKGTPLLTCWVSSEECPIGFHGECYESSTFVCGCACRGD